VKAAGQIVLFRFPQTDLSLGKLRPALLLKQLPNSYDDWLICMISSKTVQEVSELDDIISSEEDEFAQTGLRIESVIRTTRIAVASEKSYLAR
jgi:mRNA interferase MazF